MTIDCGCSESQVLGCCYYRAPYPSATSARPIRVGGTRADMYVAQSCRDTGGWGYWEAGEERRGQGRSEARSGKESDSGSGRSERKEGTARRIGAEWGDGGSVQIRGAISGADPRRVLIARPRRRVSSQSASKSASVSEPCPLLLRRAPCFPSRSSHTSSPPPSTRSAAQTSA